VALSQDEGETWYIKTLIGTQPRPGPGIDMGGAATLGYSAMRQAPNGVIHLITSVNRPSLHLAFNEAWILNDTAGMPADDESLMGSTATTIPKVKTCREKYGLFRKKAVYTGGVADDGRWLLHGTQTWYYRSGRRMHQATYRLGVKIGEETYWRPDGSVKWRWNHAKDGKSTRTQFRPNGRRKAVSTWRNFMADGAAKLWDADGRLVSGVEFSKGLLGQ
jgi:hypothetical protein